jgi:hypothetical protein
MPTLVLFQLYCGSDKKRTKLGIVSMLIKDSSSFQTFSGSFFCFACDWFTFFLVLSITISS